MASKFQGSKIKLRNRKHLFPKSFFDSTFKVRTQKYTFKIPIFQTNNKMQRFKLSNVRKINSQKLFPTFKVLNLEASKIKT